MQRNMAANCGMDYRAAGEFVASIALKDLQLLKSGGEGDGLDGVYSKSEARGDGSLPWSDRVLQRNESMLPYSAQCQAAPTLAGDEPDRDLRATLAAKLRLKQALPMLEGLIARGLCGDDCCSNPASEVCKRAEFSSAGFRMNEDPPSDVQLAAPAGLSSTQEALPSSGSTQPWRGMDDGEFWQTMWQLALDIKAHVPEAALCGNTLKMGPM